MLPTETDSGARAPSRTGVVLETRRLVKRYPGTEALRGIDFRLHAGRINVLVGENGAGKSTLMKILAGVEHASAGQVLWNGRPVSFESVRDAARYGIAMFHQELNLLPNLNIAENIFAGRELHNRWGFVRLRRQEEESVRVLALLQHPVPPKTIAGSLPLGQQQIVELARALAQEARILILDEPTSALTPAEVEILFRVIARLKSGGITVLYVSHRLNEVLEIGDCFTVLRDGQIVGEAERSAISREWLVERMTGRELTPETVPAAASAAQQEILDVRSMTLSDSARQQARTLLNDISFALHKGEILGVFGLLGAGRTELLECLAGLRPGFAGDIRLRGCTLNLESVAAAIRSGVVLVPEDRKRDGLVPELSVGENIVLMIRETEGSGFWINRRRDLEKVQRLQAALNLKADDLDAPVSSLSGGNQQKAILARCLLAQPAVLLLDEPTRGVDVGAKAEIYRILRGLAEQGLSILFTTSEAEEIWALADRCLVLSRGRITVDETVSRLSEERLYNAASKYREASDRVQ